MRYHKCVSNRAWQDSALTRVSSLVGISSLIGVFFLARHKASYQAWSELLAQIPVKAIQKAFKF